MNSEFANRVRTGDLLIRNTGLAIVLKTVPFDESIPVMYFWDENHRYPYPYRASVQHTMLPRWTVMKVVR